MESTGELSAHLTTGAVIVYGIEWLKKSPWFSRITPETKVLNRIVSAVLAAIASVGISWQYDAHLGQLVITGLTWSTVAVSAWEFLKQFVMQQLVFDGVIAKKG